MTNQPVPPPATQSPVDVATVRFIADALRRALAAVPPDVAPGPAFQAQKAEGRQELDFDSLPSYDYPTADLTVITDAVMSGGLDHRKPVPVREWGVRHGDDCKWGYRGVVWECETGHRAEELRGGQMCSATLVSRVPGGVWEPVEQEEAEAPAPKYRDGGYVAWPGEDGPVMVAPIADRFSVAEIKAAWEWLSWMPTSHSRLLAALYAGREGEQR